MDKTANYNLPQWVETDPIRMKPFNDAFDGIDLALKANSIANPSVFVRPNDKGTNAADKSTMDSLLYLTWADDSVSWYSYNTGGAYAQLNTYGTTYLYIILGYDKATEDAE